MSEKKRSRHAEEQRRYRQNNPGKIREQNKAYYEKNRDAIRERQNARQEDGTWAVRGGLIREHRKELGLSQQEYSAALGITQALLSLWERGKSPANLTVIEAAFPNLAEKLREV